MKQIRNWRTVWLGLLFFLVACGGGEISLSTANIASARLAKDDSGAQATTTFSPTDTFYLLVDLANAPDDTTVKAEWTAVSVAGADPNTILDDVELTSGSSTLTFDLANDNPWPTGDYKVDLYLNGELDQTLTFRVSAGLGQSAPAETPTPVTEAVVTETGTSGTAVSTLDAVKSATIQIQAEGSFVDPQVGLMLNIAGRGSGVIIDPSGIAVTNNHVVTGAALLKVWIGGETSPRNARILGVSECSDLAVIDIDGEGFPFMQWYDGPINVGLDIYAAGFPLGDPEFTLTRGIISKANAYGETNWASIDAALEHDASINPGNSGGPLVDGNGRIVGINYAGSNEVNQYFAIARDEARPVIEQLRAGQDVTSIGVNGQAVSDGQGLYGIWVSSVKSGSPADRVGVKAGDIITTLEGLVLATDGSMADYCDILRTHAPTDPLNIEVLRFNTQEVLAGQLNGRELVATYSFAQNLEEEVPANNGGGSDAPTTYGSYTTITDDTGTLALEVPTAWADVDGSAWVIDDQPVGQQLAASPDLNGYYNTWETPGVVFAVSADLAGEYTTGDLLDLIDFSDSCTSGGREAYADELYSGAYDLWTDCGGIGTLFVVLAAQPEAGNQMLLVQVQIVTDADLEALDHILASFVAAN